MRDDRADFMSTATSSNCIYYQSPPKEWSTFQWCISQTIQHHNCPGPWKRHPLCLFQAILVSIAYPFSSGSPSNNFRSPTDGRSYLYRPYVKTGLNRSVMNVGGSAYPGRKGFT